MFRRFCSTRCKTQPESRELTSPVSIDRVTSEKGGMGTCDDGFYLAVPLPVRKKKRGLFSLIEKCNLQREVSIKVISIAGKFYNHFWIILNSWYESMIHCITNFKPGGCVVTNSVCASKINLVYPLIWQFIFNGKHSSMFYLCFYL